jgi:hypothetical protein
VTGRLAISESVTRWPARGNERPDKMSRQAQTDLTTRTTERYTATAALSSANANLAAQTTFTGQAAAGAIAGLSVDQLRRLLGVIYPLVPNSSLCGYGRSFFTSGNYTSYEFTRYIC